MSDQQLVDFSGEHLLHELAMLWEAARELPSRTASFETPTLVETFVLHLRNMIDFLYRPGKGDDVTAEDFLDAGTTWDRSEPGELTTAHNRANKELNHPNSEKAGCGTTRSGTQRHS